jgi:hypothetical protein
MLRRLLNITSIVCCAAFVALMAMWVRSYHSKNEWRGNIVGDRKVSIASAAGRISLSKTTVSDDAPSAWRQEWEFENGSPVSRWRSASDPLQPRQPRLIAKPTQKVLTHLGVGVYFSSTDAQLKLPYWLLVLASGSLATVVQLRWPWRFTLRHLFIVTTFLAVVLGMTACLDRSWIGK